MKFKSLIKQFQNHRQLAIFTHDHPDPDCIASAYILSMIAKQHGISSKIIYGGHLTRSENKSMVKQLGIEMINLEACDTNAFDLFAIVDTQKNAGNNSLPESIVPHITFDHHAGKQRPRHFYDIDCSAGATCTIVLQYFLKLGLEPDAILATAYCYAIIAETKDMDRGATPKDIRYFNKLYKYANHQVISRIRHAKKPLAYFETLKRALNRIAVEGELISCYIGKVKSADFVPEIADMFVNIEGIQHSFIVAQHQAKFIVSARTNHREINLSNLLIKILKKHGTAGGHAMIAAGQFQGDPQVIMDRFRQEISKLKSS